MSEMQRMCIDIPMHRFSVDASEGVFPSHDWYARDLFEQKIDEALLVARQKNTRKLTVLKQIIKVSLHSFVRNSRSFSSLVRSPVVYSKHAISKIILSYEIIDLFTNWISDRDCLKENVMRLL